MKEVVYNSILYLCIKAQNSKYTQIAKTLNATNLKCSKDGNFNFCLLLELSL